MFETFLMCSFAVKFLPLMVGPTCIFICIIRVHMHMHLHNIQLYMCLTWARPDYRSSAWILSVLSLSCRPRYTIHYESAKPSVWFWGLMRGLPLLLSWNGCFSLPTGQRHRRITKQMPLKRPLWFCENTLILQIPWGLLSLRHTFWIDRIGE